MGTIVKTEQAKGDQIATGVVGVNSVEKVKGITIPLAFSTNKLSRRTENRTSKPVNGYMELYFSPRAIKVDEVDLVEPGQNFAKAKALYKNHHVYGEHSFLIPATKVQTEKYEAPWNVRFAFAQVGTEPTTATYFENLQLLPCSTSNLELFSGKLLTEPFYIEVTDESFVLHIRAEDGREVRVPAQDYSPKCWHGFAHPVVTLETASGRKPFYKFSDIPWQDIARNI